MENSIIIQSQLDKPTLKKGIKRVLENAKSVKMIRFAGIGLVLFSLGLFVYMKGNSFAPLQGVFVGIVFIYFASIMSFFNIRKLHEQDKVFEKLTYEFRIDTITIKGETFEGYLDWERIKEVIETKEYFLLYQSALGASVIPKKDFKDEQAADFRDLITTLPGLKNNILD